MFNDFIKKLPWGWEFTVITGKYPVFPYKVSVKNAHKYDVIYVEGETIEQLEENFRTELLNIFFEVKSDGKDE